jgi:hypothetical protein
MVKVTLRVKLLVKQILILLDMMVEMLLLEDALVVIFQLLLT